MSQIPEIASFKDASDALRTLVLLEDIAVALGASARDVRNMRRDSNSRKFVSAPDGWEEMIAGLAEKHADAMKDLAAQLRLRG